MMHIVLVYYWLSMYQKCLKHHRAWSPWLFIRSLFGAIFLVGCEALYGLETTLTVIYAQKIQPPHLLAYKGSYLCCMLGALLILAIWVTNHFIKHPERLWKYSYFSNLVLSIILVRAYNAKSNYWKYNTYSHWVRSLLQQVRTIRLPSDQRTALLYLLTPPLLILYWHESHLLAVRDSYKLILNLIYYNVTGSTGIWFIHALLSARANAPLNSFVYYMRLDEHTRISKNNSRFRRKFNKHDFYEYHFIPWRLYIALKLHKIMQIPPHSRTTWIFNVDYHAQSMHICDWRAGNVILLYLVYEYDIDKIFPLRRKDRYVSRNFLRPALFNAY